MFPWIIAHRGAMAEAPENTMPAFRLALERSADGIELDVQSSRDGIPVVFHDPDLKKISGSMHAVSSFLYEELCGMDFGAWFDRSFSGEQVPSLEDVLIEFGAGPRLLIEIKPDSSADSGSFNRYLAKTVPDMVKKYIPQDFIKRVMILSFDPDIIKTAAIHAPELKYGLNLNEECLDFSGLAFRPCAVSLPLARMSRGFAERCRSRGLAAMTYSCNTEDQAAWALDAGIDIILTDDPERICSFVKG